MNKEVPSVPYHVADRPKEVLKGSTRLDGRGYEVFRNVCEFSGLLYLQSATISLALLYTHREESSHMIQHLSLCTLCLATRRSSNRLHIDTCHRPNHLHAVNPHPLGATNDR